MKRRLALACTRGWRQESFVNEALAAPVEIQQDRWGYVTVGESKLQWQSYRNLRARLVHAGFVLVKTENYVHLRFPEEES